MPAKIDVSPQLIAEWRREYESGASLRDIARALGFGTNTVRKYLLADGVVFDKGAHISAKLRGRPGHRLGAKQSAEARAKMSIARKGNNYCVGRQYSPETIEKMRRSALARTDRPPPKSRRRKSSPKAPASSRHPRPKIRVPRPPRPSDKIAAKFAELQRQKFKRLLRSILRKTKLRKHGRTAALLGYTQKELMAHIEAMFEPGMSWADPKSFSIDHIVPIDAFVKSGIIDPMIVSSLVNLRPLTLHENQRKSNKYDMTNFANDLAKIVAFNLARQR